MPGKAFLRTLRAELEENHEALLRFKVKMARANDLEKKQPWHR
jgi:hypothetical protein